jgi:hypothetical protein
MVSCGETECRGRRVVGTRAGREVITDALDVFLELLRCRMSELQRAESIKYPHETPNTYVDITVLVETRETFKRRLDIFSRDIAHVLCFEHAHEPPITVRVVHEEETVALDDAGLTLDGRGEAVQGIHQVKVDALVWDGEGGGTVVLVVHVVHLAVVGIGIVFEDGMFLVGCAAGTILVGCVGVGVHV